MSSSLVTRSALANNRAAVNTATSPLDAHELEVLWHAIDSDRDDEDDADDQPVDMDDGDDGEFARLLAMATPSGMQSPSSSSASSAASSPSTSGGAAAAAAGKTAGGATAPPKRKPRKFTPEQVVMRRKRNRDSMRRVRQRKQVEVEHLRQQMELLEDKLDELRVVRDQTGAATPAAGGGDDAPVAPHAQPRRTKADVQELLEGIKALQVEQMYLHTAILSHQQVSASLMQVINESESVMFRPEPSSSGLFQDSDEFQWVNAVLPLLPPLTHACVFDLVRESYLDIVRHIALADAQLESPNQVLGWSDRRAVNGTWADFLFSKEFAHEEMDQLAAKTWRVLTHLDQSNGFQSKSLKLKVLDKLNDDTLVMARSSYSPLERKYYNSIYVLLRVETADGYVFGGRTVCPLPEFEHRMHEALGDDRAYSHMFYGLMFSRLEDASASTSVRNRGCDLVESTSPYASPSSSPATAESSPSPPPPPTRFAHRGVRVKYGGRVGNGSPLMAQAWAMDVLLAALRWENSCVKPLKLLSA